MLFVKSLQVYLLAVLAAAVLLTGSGTMAASDHQVNQTGAIEGEDLQLSGPGSDAPMLEQTSEEGIYLIQLRWAQLQLDPNDAIALEIVFLNASMPRGIDETEPPVEGRIINETTQGGPEGGDLEVESTLPVKSYNITIYSEDEKEIWKKINQPGEGGRAGQLVDFGFNYTGPVNIRISEIVPGWDTNGVNPEEMTDAVTFSAVVVPEFPVPGVVAIASTIMVSFILIGTRVHRLSK